MLRINTNSNINVDQEQMGPITGAKGQCSNKHRVSNKRQASIKRQGFEARVQVNARGIY